MGGNAFGRPARRLSQGQYEVLKVHVHQALSPIFEGLMTPRNLSSKIDHGDLDVLVIYAQALPYGDEEWVGPESNGEAEVSALANIPAPDPLVLEVIKKLDIKPALAPLSVVKQSEGPNGGGIIKVWGTGKTEIPEGEDVNRMRDLCGTMRESIQAIAWRRRGSEVSFKVPCQVIDKAHKGDNQFYQVDVVFVRPEHIAFHNMMSSYSSTGLLLGRLIRNYSKHLTLHLTHLIVRHSPYPGIPAIDVTLTSSPERFCLWLGLDYQAWEDAGEGTWSTNADLWKWLTDVPQDSIAGQAISRIVTRRNKPSIHDQLTGKRKKRAEFADGLYEWLQDDPRWAVSPEAEQNEGDVGSHEAWKSPTPTPTPISTVIAAESVDLSIHEQKSLVDLNKESVEYNEKLNSNLDPVTSEIARTYLDARTSAALEYWGKQGEYDELLEERKAAAGLLAERQRDRVDRKEKMEGDQKKYELEVKDW